MIRVDKPPEWRCLGLVTETLSLGFSLGFSGLAFRVLGFRGLGV